MLKMKIHKPFMEDEELPLFTLLTRSHKKYLLQLQITEIREDFEQHNSISILKEDHMLQTLKIYYFAVFFAGSENRNWTDVVVSDM